MIISVLETEAETFTNQSKLSKPYWPRHGYEQFSTQNPRPNSECRDRESSWSLKKKHKIKRFKMKIVIFMSIQVANLLDHRKVALQTFPIATALPRFLRLWPPIVAIFPQFVRLFVHISIIIWNKWWLDHQLIKWSPLLIAFVQEDCLGVKGRIWT